MNESLLHEDRFVDVYNELFDKLLLSSNISDTKIYELFNIHNNKITSAPHIIKGLLMKKQLSAFKFLMCKN